MSGSWFAGFFALAVAGFLICGWQMREPVYKGKTASQWADQLQSSNPKTFSEAEQAIRQIGAAATPVMEKRVRSRRNGFIAAAQKAANHLPKILRDPTRGFLARQDDLMKQIAAAHALRTLGPVAEPAIPVLGEVLREGNSVLSSAAATAMGSIGPAAVPELARSLDSKNYLVRANACLALRSIGPAASGACRRLAEMLESSNADDLALASFTLGRIGQPAMPLLNDKMCSSNILTLVWSAKAIGIAGPYGQKAAPALLRQASHPDARVREAVISALGNISVFSAEANNALKAALQDPQAEVRRSALQAVFDGRPRLAAACLPRIIQLASDENSDIRTLAAKTLGVVAYENPLALPALEGLLNDKQAGVRKEAALVLAQVAPRQGASPHAPVSRE
jgi:HEAT repeat protein